MLAQADYLGSETAITTTSLMILSLCLTTLTSVSTIGFGSLHMPTINMNSTH